MELKELEQKYEELGKEIERLKNLPKNNRIDFSKLPVDTLVEVSDGKGRASRFGYFSGVNSSFFKTGIHGCSNKTNKDWEYSDWGFLRIVENPIKPWFGGEQPIPDGVPFKVWFRGDANSGEETRASSFYWQHDRDSCDIIAYQILEMKEWYNVKGEVVNNV